MPNIKAKPVSNEFWILQKDNKKIGQVVHTDDSYTVKINGRIAGTYTTLKKLKEDNLFDFTEMPKPRATASTDVHGYPTNDIAYNGVWNLQYNLPLFTLEPESKSWHAAGYYNITIKGKTVTEFCPKLITLQRNKYSGPYKEKPIEMFDELFEK